MKEKFFKNNNGFPIIVALISSITAIVIGYWQVQANKSVGTKSITEIRDEIDLKIKPTEVKLDMLLAELNEFKHNQEKINDTLRDWLKSLSNRQPVSLNSLDKSVEIQSLQHKNKILFTGVKKK